MKKNPLVAFVLTAYAISWLIWLPLLLAQRGLLANEPTRYLHLIGALGPAIAAGFAAVLRGGNGGLRSLARRIFAWRVPALWHVVAWVVPFALFAVALGISRLAGERSWSAELLGRSAEYPELSALSYWAASIVFYGFGEEIGWRGYALPCLQRDRSALKATLALTLIWAGWHLPLFWFAPGLSRMGVAESLGWLISLLTAAILFTWLMNSAGSILIAAVFHGTMDIVFISQGTPILTNVLGALVTLWGLAVVALTGPRYLSRRRNKLLLDEEGRLVWRADPAGGEQTAAKPAPVRPGAAGLP